MKTNYITKLLAASLIVVLFLMAACSKDDLVVPDTGDQTSDLIVKDTLKLKIGNTVAVPIEKGNGDYNVFSLNPEMVTATLDGNAINVKSISKGITDVILSDKAEQIKRLYVISYLTDTINFDFADPKNYIFQKRMGWPGTNFVKIIEGNGEYKVKAEDPDSILTSLSFLSDDTLSISADKKGSAFLTVSDFAGVSHRFQMTVQETDEPYTKDELEQLKANQQRLYSFDESIQKYQDHSYYYTFINDVEDGLNVYGFKNKFGYSYQYIRFAGDKSVGTKSNATIDFYDKFGDEGENKFENQPVKFEIVKNDGTKIWMVYSFVKNEKLHYGYCCENILNTAH